MPKMRAVQVSRPGGPLEVVPREVPEAGPGTVRVKVQACGVCHSDSITQMGGFPGLAHPRVPGHEVAGVIDAVGANVQGWKQGQRVGVGWNGGYCGYCDSCRRGNFFACRTFTLVTGVTHDGGYADYLLTSASSLAAIPDALSPVEAAPLMCAGVTTFNALRNSGARPGDRVAVLGLGGLGHLGVQFAAKMGFRTVAIARGQDKEPLARKLGASDYIDSTAQAPSAALQKMGGVSVILSTVTNADAMKAAMGGLAPKGTFLLLGVDHTLEVPPIQLITGAQSIRGWYSGVSVDSQDTLEFCAQTGVRSMNETLPLERAAEGFERMLSGKARFRVILTTGN